MRPLAIAALIVSATPAFAFNPCLGPREDAREATAGLLRDHADAMARGEGKAGDAITARRREILAAPSADMVAAAALAQAAANQRKADCDAAAAAQHLAR